METADLLIYNASELTTMKGHSPKVGNDMKSIGSLKNGAIASFKGKIVAVGTLEAVMSLTQFVPEVQKIDAQGKLVTPGLVDAHTHLIFAGSRENEYVMKIIDGLSYEEIEASGGGVMATVRQTRNADINALVVQARRVLGRMLMNGTTTIEAKSGYTLQTDGEIKLLETMQKLNSEGPIEIVPTLFGAHDIPLEFKDNPDGFLDLIIHEMIPEVAKRNLACFCDSGVTFPPEQTELIFEAAKSNGMRVKVHSDEFHNAGGAALAAKCNAISAEHCLNSSDEDIKAMSEKGVIAVVLPAVPLVHKLKHFSDARRFIDQGMAVALGTDFNPSCLVDSMPLVMSLGCYCAGMTPAEALTAATINAACAIGKENTVGSLDLGKQMDLVIWNITNHVKLTEPLGGAQAHTVIKKGAVVFKQDNPYQ